METIHPEGDSPFIVKDDEDKTSDIGYGATFQASSLQNNFVECNVDGCGEGILIAELGAHLDLHAAQDLSEQFGREGSGHLSSSQTDQIDQGEPTAAAAWARMLKMPPRGHKSQCRLKHSVLMRLGVCGLALVIFTAPLTNFNTCRNHRPNSDPMQTRSRCQVGSKSSLKQMGTRKLRMET